MQIAEMSASRVTDIAQEASAPRNADAENDAVSLANALLASLSDEQRSEAMYNFDDSSRPYWSNLPAGILDFERNGIRLGELDDGQVRLVFDFLATALSADGYRKVIDVVGADEVLSHSERAGHFAWTDENYWMAFFGQPSDSEKWAWQFGGHHLGVNVTLANGRSYFSPTFVGVEPAAYRSGDRTVAPLAAELDSGLAHHKCVK